MSTTGPKSKSIAVITCSTRPGRISPLITSQILPTLQAALHKNTADERTTTIPSNETTEEKAVTISVIDLASVELPAFTACDSAIPKQFPRDDPTPHYSAELTRVWSATVASHSAFVFVTPQYNWGYPAPLKYALDLLYWEWAGKPAWIISYGGHGGGRCANQLAEVLQGLEMKVVGGPAVLAAPSHPPATVAVTATTTATTTAEGELTKDQGKTVELKVPVPLGLKSIAAGAVRPEIIEYWDKVGVEDQLKRGFADLVAMLGTQEELELPN